MTDGAPGGGPEATGRPHLPPGGGAVVTLCVDACDGGDEWAVTVVGPARTVIHDGHLATYTAPDQAHPVETGDGHRSVVLTIGLLRGWRVAPAPLVGHGGAA